MKTNEEDFKKAVGNKISGNLGGTLLCGFFALIFIDLGYSFYTIDQDVSLIFWIIGLFASLGLIYNLIETLTIGLYSNKEKQDNYHLCKRCKCLVKKDKIFCNDCKYDIKRSLKHLEDEKYFNEYKKIIKEKEKKK